MSCLLDDRERNAIFGLPAVSRLSKHLGQMLM
jgi:hypothetical protein